MHSLISTVEPGHLKVHGLRVFVGFHMSWCAGRVARLYNSQGDAANGYDCFDLFGHLYYAKGCANADFTRQ